jgi:ATP-binding cassette subfamily C (CFTR/MRP) protein 1
MNDSSFCGGDLWDLDVTWNTDDPDFTPCFHKTVLAWAPSVIYLFFAALEMSKYFKGDVKKIPWNVYNVAKLLMTASLVVLSIVEVAIVGVTAGDDDALTEIFPVDYVTPVVYLVTYLTSLVMLWLSLKRGIRTSAAQFFLFFASLVCGAVTFR